MKGEGTTGSVERKERGEEEEDDEDDEESSCSGIAYQSVSPKATEPLILIIGYSLDFLLLVRLEGRATACSDRK